MRTFLTQSQMKLVDENTIQYYHMPQLVLMERAALAVKEEILSQKRAFSNCLVVCGTGNNGADGVALARLLNQSGMECEIYMISDDEQLYSNALSTQLDIYRRYGFPITQLLEDKYDLIVDAIFGFGLSREIRSNYKNVLDQLNRMKGFKLAIDVPSGVSCETGQILGGAFRADITVTFAFEKVGMHLWPGNEATGQIVVKDIGITSRSFLDVKPECFALEEKDLVMLPKRSSHTNKGSYGKVLVVAGAKGMSGACYLSAKAAFRMGCGMVRIFTEESNREIIGQILPEAMISTYDSSNYAFSKEAFDWADVIIIGPGIGTGACACRLVKDTLDYTLTNHKKLVIDADGLNIIAKEGLESLLGSDMILTPHMGEASRLMKLEVKEIQSNPVIIARNYATTHGVNLILKDARSISVSYDGTAYLNFTGNSGMATAGSGDVLSGILGSLLAQGIDLKMAGPFAAFLHGMAGDYARETYGERSLMAEDIISALVQVLKRWEEMKLS